jgi:hypothetical protein
MNRWRKRSHAAAAAVIAAVAVLLSGCVYLRLLELKHQIAAFDRNFAVSTESGVRIECRNPVLLTGDVKWIGLAPEHTKTVGVAQDWDVRWVKDLPPDVHETGAFDIVIQMRFVEDKLTRVAIPERYFAVMSKTLLIDLLRSLGGAKVDRDRRSIEAQLASSRPDLPAIGKLLGLPTDRKIEESRTILHYRYVPVATARLARAAVFDMTLRFDTSTGQLLRWGGRTPVGSVGFNFEKKPDEPGS